MQVNSEFYTGWLDHWGDQHAMVSAQKVSRVLEEMLTMGASVNMYVVLNSQASSFPSVCRCLISQQTKGLERDYLCLLGENPCQLYT